MNREKYMFKILKSILNKENIDNVSRYLIYPDKRGYVMYDEYIIKTPVTGNFIVEKLNTHTVKKFNSLRNAVIWVTFDKSNKIMYSKKIEELDILIASTESNIQVQKNLLKKSKNLDSTSLAYAKMTEESTKKSYLLQELDYFITFSRTLQEHNFDKLTK